MAVKARSFIQGRLGRGDVTGGKTAVEKTAHLNLSYTLILIVKLALLSSFQKQIHVQRYALRLLRRRCLTPQCLFSEGKHGSLKNEAVI